jgi:hypothetical protein
MLAQLRSADVSSGRVLTAVESFRVPQPADVCNDYNVARTKFAALSQSYLEAKTKENVLKVVHSASSGAVAECSANRAKLVEKAAASVAELAVDASGLAERRAASRAARLALVADASVAREERDALVAEMEAAGPSTASTEYGSGAECEAALVAQTERVQALNSRKVELEDQVEEQRWEIANLEQRHGALQAELDSATTAMRAEGGAAATLEAPETALARARAAVAAVAQLGGVTITADEPTVLILQSAGGGYRLALDFDASALSGATLTPSDVEIDDIVAAAIAPGIGGAPRKGPAWLIREVRARLS